MLWHRRGALRSIAGVVVGVPLEMIIELAGVVVRTYYYGLILCRNAAGHPGRNIMHHSRVRSAKDIKNPKQDRLVLPRSFGHIDRIGQG